MNSSTTIGVIEIGSRSVRMLVAQPVSGRLEIIKTRHKETLFSEAMEIDGGPSVETIALVKEVVEEFRCVAEESGAKNVTIFGTSAWRKYVGRSESVLDDWALDVLVMSEADEAECSLLASVKESKKNALVAGQNILMLDQGAGSLEIATGVWEGGAVSGIQTVSWEFGSERLIAKLVSLDNNLTQFIGWARHELEKMTFLKLQSDDVVAYALGSVATNTAWLSLRDSPDQFYNPRVVQGHILSVGDIGQLIGKLYELFQKDRNLARIFVDPRNPKGNEYERIVSGLVIHLFIVKKFGISFFEVCSLGTRHGFTWKLSSGGTAKLTG